MSLSEQDVKKIILTDDIFPLGKFETLQVTPKLDGLADSYPYVTVIKTGIDYIGLLEEAKIHMDIVGRNYVKPRVSKLNPNVTEPVLRDVLEHVGFFKDTYQSFALRKIGTNELEDWVLPKTRTLFEDLNSQKINVFRQQYAVAYPGWNIKLHRDHENFLIHGFRAMVPLSADVYMGYEDENKNNLVFRLKRGGMYFVNIAKMHRGFNGSTEDRVNLIFQMDKDDLVLDSIPIAPLNAAEISTLPKYASEYEAWRFGYEL